jgi:hypothetical protein
LMGLEWGAQSFNVTSLFVLPLILSGCLLSQIQSQGLDSSRFDPAQRLSPTNFEQHATMKDTSVHEDPTLLRVGVSRQQIAAAFGAPNETSNQEPRMDAPNSANIWISSSRLRTPPTKIEEVICEGTNAFACLTYRGNRSRCTFRHRTRRKTGSALRGGSVHIPCRLDR